MTYQFNFDVISENYRLFIEGVLLTIQISTLSMIIGLGIALVTMLGKISRFRVLRIVASVYIEAIRNTPFIIQIFLLYFGLPSIGIRLDPNTAAVVGLSVNVGAYAAEIIRGGVLSIDRGQSEAGLALGLGPFQVFRYIVFKPAMRAIYPALTSQFILLLLTSSIVSSITANELTHIAMNLESTTFRSFEIYIVVTLIYLLLTIVFSRIFNLIYRITFTYPTK